MPLIDFYPWYPHGLTILLHTFPGFPHYACLIRLWTQWPLPSASTSHPLLRSNVLSFLETPSLLYLLTIHLHLLKPFQEMPNTYMISTPHPFWSEFLTIMASFSSAMCFTNWLWRYNHIPWHHTNLESWQWLIWVSLIGENCEMWDCQQVRGAIGASWVMFSIIQHANNTLDY